jgi:hypothetical protein
MISQGQTKLEGQWPQQTTRSHFGWGICTANGGPRGRTQRCRGMPWQYRFFFTIPKVCCELQLKGQACDIEGRIPGDFVWAMWSPWGEPRDFPRVFDRFSVASGPDRLRPSGSDPQCRTPVPSAEARELEVRVSATAVHPCELGGVCGGRAGARSRAATTSRHP